MRDSYNDKAITVLQTPATLSADTETSSVDLQFYESCLIVVEIGVDAALDGSNYWNIGIEESDDDSAFTDVAEADMIGAISGTTTGQFALVDSTAEDAAAYMVGYIGAKRYVRVHLDETGTLSGPISAIAIAGDYKYPPVS